jgi:methyl-accepting chemotaxis protein
MKPTSFFRKLYWAQGALVSACLLSLAALFWSLSNQDSAATHSLAWAAYSQKVHAAALSLRKLRHFSKSTNSIAQAKAARREASLRLAQIRSAARSEVSPEESAELDKLSSFVFASGNLLAKIDGLKRRGHPKEASALYDARLRHLIERYVSGAVSERLREERTGRLENERQAQLWTYTSFAAAGVFTAMSCLLFFLWTRSFVGYATDNLERIQLALRAIRSGRFKIMIEPDRADELGALCTSLKGLAARLEQAQGRLDDVTELANNASRSLNEVVFAVGEYVAMSRQRRNDAQDEYGLNLILERVGNCKLLLGKLCESVAGQKLLAEQSPGVLKAIEGLSGSLQREARPQKSAS